MGLVAQAGITTFVRWLRTSGGASAFTAEVFGTAPRDLTHSINLGETLDLVRTVVDIVEHDVVTLAEPGEEHLVREATLRYAREIAFAAAEVYADAAEVRGAWDARLEELVVDAVLRGEADGSMQSRAAALGWGSIADVAVVVGSTPSGGSAGLVDAMHRATRRIGVESLASVQGRRFVCILGGASNAIASAGRLADLFADGPIVVGPTVPHLFAAGRSARAAFSGYDAAPAWPDAPRPVLADDLLVERALLGDPRARTVLVDRIWSPLKDAAGGSLLSTAEAYLGSGAAIEAAARTLFVHPNTVRYRLSSIETLTGYRLTDARDAFTVRVALGLGRLGRPPTGPPRLAL